MVLRTPNVCLGIDRCVSVLALARLAKAVKWDRFRHATMATMGMAWAQTWPRADMLVSLSGVS